MWDENEVRIEIGMKNYLLYDINDWPSNSEHHYYKNIIENFMEVYCSEKMYHCKFIFRYVDVENRNINAHVFKKIDTFFLLLNFNCIPVLKSYFYTLSDISSRLKQKVECMMLPEMPLLPIIEMVEYDIDFKKKRINYTKLYVGKDRNKKVADKMTEISVMFLVFHEVGHSLNGHTDFCSNEKCSSLDMRTLEMDADSFALAALNKIYFGLNENKEEIFEVFVISILSLFMFVKSESVKYMSPTSRSMLVMVMLKEELERNGINISISEFLPLIRRTDTNFKTVKRRNIGIKNTIKNLIQEEEEYQNKLKPHWKNNLKQKLEAYSFAPLSE